MGTNGSDYITREGAELMFTKMFQEYERDVITPRHEESRLWHQQMLEMLAVRKGVWSVLKAVAAGVGVFWTCIEIWRVLHK
jgi:hypothetical protein